MVVLDNNSCETMTSMMKAEHQTVDVRDCESGVSGREDTFRSFAVTIGQAKGSLPAHVRYLDVPASLSPRHWLQKVFLEPKTAIVSNSFPAISSDDAASNDTPSKENRTSNEGYLERLHPEPLSVRAFSDTVQSLQNELRQQGPTGDNSRSRLSTTQLCRHYLNVVVVGMAGAGKSESADRSVTSFKCKLFSKYNSNCVCNHSAAVHRQRYVRDVKIIPEKALLTQSLTSHHDLSLTLQVQPYDGWLTTVACPKSIAADSVSPRPVGDPIREHFTGSLWLVVAVTYNTPCMTPRGWTNWTADSLSMTCGGWCEVR